MSFTLPPDPPPVAPPTPSRNDEDSVFDGKANAHAAWLTPFTNALRALRAWLVIFIGELTAAQQLTADAAEAASEAASAAAASAGAADVDALATGTDRNAANNSRVQAALSATTSTEKAAEAAGSATTAAQARADTVQLKQDTQQLKVDAQAAALQAGRPFTGTSATGIKVEQGDVAFVTQTGLGFVPGQRYGLARTSVPSVAMFGAVKTYNPATGAFTGTRDRADGAGTFTDWTLGLGGTPGASGARPTVLVTADIVAAAGNDYVFKGNYLLTIPAALALNDTFGISNGTGLAGPRIDFGTTKVKGRTPGVVTMTRANAATVVKFTADADVGFTEV